jgi:predicted AlkP superfamily pyrophosphatase or phosphodiesterase
MNFPENESDFLCITSLTPTVCDLCGVRRPAQCGDEPIKVVMDAVNKELNGGKIEKMLIFAPDAVGIQLWEKFPEEQQKVESLAPIRVPIQSVMPSVTPVNFGSMYSGALPVVHGIQKYEKPVLTCETLFNVFPEAGKKTAICAINGCSIDTIFRKRPVTYISTRSDADALMFTENILNNYDYDFILSYATAYDSVMHHTEPFAPEALTAFKTDVASFQTLVALTDKVWKGYNRLIIWSPDHGSHLNPDTKHGTHGSDMPEDKFVYHFYRVKAAEK